MQQAAKAVRTAATISTFSACSINVRICAKAEQFSLVAVAFLMVEE